MNPARPMPTDFDNDRVLEEWELQETEFRLRDLLDERVRGEFLETLLWLSLGTMVVGLSLQTGMNVLSGVSLLLGLGTVVLSMLALDAINCRVSPTHECRACRKETSRWRSEHPDPVHLSGHEQLLASGGDEETDGGN